MYVAFEGRLLVLHRERSSRVKRPLSPAMTLFIPSPNSLVEVHRSLLRSSLFEELRRAACRDCAFEAEPPLEVIVPHVRYLFGKACLHVARVSRVLQQAGGHAMLIGVGGSGKQSLAKLAVFMAELAPMTIVISKSYNLSDFKADLQVRRAPGRRTTSARVSHLLRRAEVVGCYPEVLVCCAATPI